MPVAARRSFLKATGYVCGAASGIFSAPETFGATPEAFEKLEAQAQGDLADTVLRRRAPGRRLLLRCPHRPRPNRIFVRAGREAAKVQLHILHRAWRARLAERQLGIRRKQDYKRGGGQQGCRTGRRERSGCPAFADQTHRLGGDPGLSGCLGHARESGSLRGASRGEGRKAS
jgi:hypothetical protein